MNYHPHHPSYSDYFRWKALVEEGKYKVVTPSALSGLIPQSLLEKVQPSVVMSSASGSFSIFVANLNRVDTPQSAIDQQPYVTVFEHSLSAAYGGFVDHGKWSERTTRQDQVFFNHISASGTAAYYPLSQLPPVQSGLLNEIPIPSQQQAFATAFSAWQATQKQLKHTVLLIRFNHIKPPKPPLQWHLVFNQY